ncbi:uncharacterized protein LOC110465291 [Mizuhopecten yessoensis]|uniref:uncharacterized protein LOC110465291 n=1 Tax=Mizuhopecten yessoensis TaxID=6573 RepID=UPI000B45F720|nr:uncharacterized protein LOC110465291 [Mizuhopecten yessoensis]
MKAVELMGYNKLGLNTFPNMVAILLGITVDEMNDDNTFYDRYPFIWKDFMEAGYVTLMGEDTHDQSLFNYQRKGFKWTPVDYYMRPHVMALEQNSGSNKTWCSGNFLVLQSVLDKLVEFVASYRDVPHFAFTFIGKPSHDNSNRLGIVDLPLLRTLTDLNTRGLLDNTVLMIFGDHGSRYGKMRNTFQGRLEENLPAFYVFLPQWFRKTHSYLFENLKTNRKKLTSNFDVYATLQDILGLGRGHLSPKSSGKYGTSLLRNIRTKRTMALLFHKECKKARKRYKKEL